MRLRLQTFSPLPELKAWFIPEIPDTHETVFDLKGLICRGIPQLRASQIHAQHLILLLEGFELLNDSPISAVRDGDLLAVKTAHRIKKHVDMGSKLALQSRKRKRDSNEFDRSPRKISSRGASTRLVSSTSNVSQSSTSEESSSDSESNTSDSSSDSSSSTSSSDSSPPTFFVKKVLDPPQLEKRQLAGDPFKQPSKTTHVPPGRGKPSTHSRNQRRKKKREFEKLSKAGLLTHPNGISGTNNLPPVPTRTETITNPPTVPMSAPPLQTPSSNEVGPTSTIPPENNPESSSSKYVHITPDQVMMGSLRNKNKKKGFKQTMTGPIPRKIVFPGGVGQEDSCETNTVLDDHAPQDLRDHRFSEANKPVHRLIPPSELQNLGKLPSNVFVTSVDVEKHIWGSQNGLPKKKRGKKWKSMYDDEGGYGFEEDREQWGGYDEGLPYGDGGQAEGETLVASNGIDWDKAEKLWEASSPVPNIQQLNDGVVFGWKELALNPQTFTPEMLLFLARIISVTREGTDCERDDANVRIRFRQLRRPGGNEAAVAFGVAAGGSEDVEGGDDMEEEECVAWADVLEGRWRLVDV